MELSAKIDRLIALMELCVPRVLPGGVYEGVLEGVTLRESRKGTPYYIATWQLVLLPDRVVYGHFVTSEPPKPVGGVFSLDMEVASYEGNSTNMVTGYVLTD